MNRSFMLVLGLLFVMAGRSELMGAPATVDRTVTLEKLLGEMVDLQRLTRLPEPAYTSRQASSYNRASKSPAENWFANSDRGQYIRTEEVAGRKEFVMMDAVGPGAIVRIWSANPEGTIRIYIDDDPRPVIEVAMKVLLGGTGSGLPRPLAGEYAGGWNCYLPIPYAKHCKVTSDKDDGVFYHVNYRTYASGTRVESFRQSELDRLPPAVSDIAATLLSPRKAAAPPADAVRKPYKCPLRPGAEEVLCVDTGSRVICEFLAHVTAANIDAAARGVVVYMTFDGEKAVECPIGDFFGTAPGLNPHASLPVGITKESTPDLWCHWLMPFAKSMKITVRNLGDQQVTLDGEVATAPYAWDDRSLHFHAGWRGEKHLLTRPFTDWTHLECTGQGRFVGGALHVQNCVRGWWGEGDEKIYVDGEAFPSTFGTGSEDYYGYAWCRPELFFHAYHNQPRCDGPSNYGNTSVNRFHIIDDIPFTKSFKFDMENWHSAERAYTNRAAVSYWYARPGGKDSFAAITPADVKLEPMPAFQAYKVEGAQEAESLKVLGPPKANVRPQDVSLPEGKWSNALHLWWRQGKPGEKLALAFQSTAAGKRNVTVGLTKASDYAIVQLYINDRKIGEPIDLYAAQLASFTVELGAVELGKGENQLAIEIVGANAASSKRHFVGIDYVLVGSQKQ